MKTEVKIKKLKALILKLEQGGRVTPSNLKALLSSDDLAEINLAWEEEKETREVAKPAAIRKYEKLLGIACGHYGLMLKYSSELSQNTYLAMKFRDRADVAFDRAIEFIRQEEDRDQDIQFWMDRDVFGEIEHDPISIPRVIGSKSFECLVKRKSPYPSQTKRGVKIQVLEEILKRMVGEFESDSLEVFMSDTFQPKSRRTDLTKDFTGFVF